MRFALVEAKMALIEIMKKYTFIHFDLAMTHELQ